MTDQAWWIVTVVLVGIIGIFTGRLMGGGRHRIAELEAELKRRDEEMAAYRGKVDAHFDRTAELFASMAGSYKNLFSHLSSGYEMLAPGSSDSFRVRVAGLLMDTPMAQTIETAAGAAAEAAAGAAPTSTPQVAPASEENTKPEVQSDGVAAADDAVTKPEAAQTVGESSEKGARDQAVAASTETTASSAQKTEESVTDTPVEAGSEATPADNKSR